MIYGGWGLAECMFNLEHMAPEPGEARVFDAPRLFLRIGEKVLATS